jgi:hypothetical protein
VSRYAQERAAALADPNLTPLKRARLTAGDGSGMTAQALSLLSNVSRDTISRGERGDRVSPATLRPPRSTSALRTSSPDVSLSCEGRAHARLPRPSHQARRPSRDARIPRGRGTRVTKPIVVSLCDLTGAFVRPWAAAGFECYCVDTQHSIRRERVDGRIHYVWGDVRSWSPPAPVAFLAAFPPCTHLAVSGARDWKTKGLPMLRDALDLFNACDQVARWSGAPYFIENPVGALSSHHRKPDHTFNPCDFGGYLDPPGDSYTKKTCLWVGNGFVMPPKRPVQPTEGSRTLSIPSGPERTNLRSATPAGFAQAVFNANSAQVITRWNTAVAA